MRVPPLSTFALSLGLAASAVPASAQETAALKGTIEMARSKFAGTGPVEVTFTLTNTSGGALHVLKWHTPLEGFKADIFRVERDGQRVPYVGPLYKRGAPRPEDYVTLAPGESATASVDLTAGYATYDAGCYTVQLEGSVFDADPAPLAQRAAKPRLAAKALESNTVTFELTEARPAPPPPEPAGPTALAKDGKRKEPVFKNCSASRQDVLSEAHHQATLRAAGTLLALAGTSEAKRPTAPRYAKWFGAYTAARYQTAIDHFTKIHDALGNQTVTFNCDCDDPGVYAYVFRNKPYEIHLCGAFWPAPPDPGATDSQPGTLIHETSHFTVVADTDDHRYGQAACAALATTSPDLALDNADSHEYFAENTN
jgi:peptidyl-Lys metalloendopeptidase